MSRGVNKVILIGNLGGDPETRSMPSGDVVANISVATSEKWKDKQSGEAKERTEWHRVAFFGRLAEVVGEYLRKGSKVYVEGSLRTRKWQDKQGNDHYSTEVIASEMQMLDGKPANGGQQQRGNGNRSNKTPQQQERERRQPSSSSGLPPDDFSDDIPF